MSDHQDLDEIERLDREATPGPWEAADGGPTILGRPDPDPRSEGEQDHIGSIDRPRDQRLVVRYRTIAPRLARELRVVRRAARKAVDATTDCAIASALEALRGVLDKVEFAERTPEIVLRGMLQAYEAAALERTEAELRGEESRGGLVFGALDDVRFALAHCRVKGRVPRHLGPRITADYEARLSGVRPLDAPPPEPGS